MLITAELHCLIKPPGLSTSLSVITTVLFHFEFHYCLSFCFLTCLWASGFFLGGKLGELFYGSLVFWGIFICSLLWPLKNTLMNSGGGTSLFSDSFSNYSQVLAVGCYSESFCCLPICLPIAILI